MAKRSAVAGVGIVRLVVCRRCHGLVLCIGRVGLLVVVAVQILDEGVRHVLDLLDLEVRHDAALCVIRRELHRPQARPRRNRR